MTLGELSDKLLELSEAQKSIVDARQSLERGGDTDTMSAKREWLRMCVDLERTLRAEVLT